MEKCYIEECSYFNYDKYICKIKNETKCPYVVLNELIKNKSDTINNYNEYPVIIIDRNGEKLTLVGHNCHGKFLVYLNYEKINEDEKWKIDKCMRIGHKNINHILESNIIKFVPYYIGASWSLSSQNHPFLGYKTFELELTKEEVDILQKELQKIKQFFI